MSRLHPAVWLLWLGVTGGLVWALRNPLYLVLLLIVSALVRAVLATSGDGRAHITNPPLLRITLIMVPLAALLNAAWVRAGTTVLFRIPAGIPLLGGPVTLEAFLYGALNGLMLLTLLSVFVTFNCALGARELLMFAPRAFGALAVTGGIAATYAPLTLRQIREINEAQAVRGRTSRGMRDWLPLFLPLLTSGLERAFQLAESLSARGYVARQDPARIARAQVMLLTGIVCASAGWAGATFALLSAAVGAGALIAGAALMAGALYFAGCGVRHTAYRVRQWRVDDALVIGALLMAAMPALLLGDTSLRFDPYAELAWPTFNPVIGGALVLLAAPAGARAR
jgi:energy-coupling factor transport system permease protein